MDQGDLVLVDQAEWAVKSKVANAHEYQMWCVLQDRQTPELVYTGADDTKFKGWDMRTGGTPIFSINDHEYGVCCIKPWLDTDAYVLMTGSYDMSLKFW